MLKAMLIENNALICECFSNLGGERIFIDLEKEGKIERQKNINAHFTSHQTEDVLNLAAKGLSSELMVRVNPLSQKSPLEVDALISCGAQRLMLPMFSTVEEIDDFRSMVKGRVPITFLAETSGALNVIEKFSRKFSSSDEIHFGLNDLSLSLKVSLFAPVFNGYLKSATSTLKCNKIPFGIGGVGDVTNLSLPVLPEKLMRQYISLGSTWVILSREFTNAVSNGGVQLQVFEERFLAFKALCDKLKQEFC